MNFPYEDLLTRPRPVSARHRPMSEEDRAAQFSPFAALTGHDDAIRETARLTDSQVELAADQQALLDEALRDLARRLPERPRAAITCFIPDSRKSGGAYATLTGAVKKIDPVFQTLTLEDGSVLPLSQILLLTPLPG